jgi:hypothetical protein
VAIAGRVELDDGAPAAGARVTIAAGPPAFTARADLHAELAGGAWDTTPERIDRTRASPDGWFHFADLPDGGYDLDVTLPGPGGRFGSATGHVDVASDAEGNIALTPVVVVLPSTSLEGRVVDGRSLYGPRVRMTPGLVSRWRLGEEDGPAAEDVGGRDAVPHGALTRAAPGLVALEDDGAVAAAGSGYLEVPYDAALNPAEFSVELWATASGGAGTVRCAVTSRDSGPGVRGFQIGAGPDDAWQLRVGDGTTWHDVAGPPAVVGSAAHVVATYDGTAARLYVDGVLSGTAPGVTVDPNRARPLRIGAGTTEGAPSAWWVGKLDEVAVYDRALPAGVVQAHYAAGAGDQIDPLPMAAVRVEGSGERTFARPDGSFRLPGLEPGLRTVAVTSAGFAPATRRVALSRGQTAHADVPLGPES